MRTSICQLSLIVAALGVCVPRVQAGDLRDGVPTDCYLAVYGQHNPERDYQKVYFDHVWETIEDTQICERFLEAIENQLDEDELQKFQNFRETLVTALEPIQWDAFGNCTESIYAQRMEVPTSQHLVLMRLPEGAADGLARAVTNLIELAAGASDGKVAAVTSEVAGYKLTTMQVPPQVPYSLSVAVLDDVFLLSSRQDFAEESIKLLQDPSAESKFDDPRLAAALEQLPEFEDALTFFDGRQLFSQLSGLSTFIRQISGGNADAERAAKLMDEIFSQVDVADYEVTVEYTEGYQNRSAAFGRVVPDWKEKVVGQMFADRQLFDDWSTWVPAGATSYSLSSGANIRPLYVWLMELIPAHFPEAKPGLERFAELQDQYDLHLDEDLLQAFSGESVSVTLPGQSASPMGPSGQSVTFMRCQKPERIKALLHRLVETLQGIPQLQAQNISLDEVEDLEGFESVNAGVFMMAGMRPVIGFRDGWMVMASSPQAVQTVLDTRAGEGETIAETEDFKKFNLEIDGPVVSLSYSNVAEQVRAMALGIQQVGSMMPMIMGMAAQQGADLQAASEFLGLLPSVGRIIGTFDFYESKLSVTQPGPDDTSYIRQSVVLVRPPAGESAE